MKSNIWIIYALTFLITPATAFELKGIEVGRPATNEQLKANLGLNCTTYCNVGQAQLAGTWAETMVELNAAHEVSKITAFFQPLYFDPISDALTAKYGKPKSVTRAKLLTGSGASLNQVTEKWRNAAGDEIELAKYADAAQGILFISTKATLDAEAAKSTKAANDI